MKKKLRRVINKERQNGKEGIYCTCFHCMKFVKERKRANTMSPQYQTSKKILVGDRYAD